jgi:hypothetical protein
LSGAQIHAVVFDLDGVLIESEQLWDEVREELGARPRRPLPRAGPGAHDRHELDEWSRYMHDVVSLDESPIAQARRRLSAPVYVSSAAG